MGSRSFISFRFCFWSGVQDKTKSALMPKHARTPTHKAVVMAQGSPEGTD